MTRIALISDIHFGLFSRTAEFSVPGESIKDENTGGESLKDSTISLLKSENITYLCIAGDLTSLGSPHEFVFCEKAVLDIAKELGIPKRNILVGLGNHDIDWNISDLFCRFDKSDPDFPLDLVKEKYRKVAASASLINLDSIVAPPKVGPAPFSGIIENDDFVLFILNTGWCCTKEQANNPGKLSKEQLEWFNKEASNYKYSNKWKIILMHHHPFNYKYHIVCSDYSTLEEGSDFLDIAGKNGFHLVIHGHRHHPRAETNWKTGWDHPITFVCAGSFSVNASHRSGGFIPNTLHIIELTDDIGVLKLCNYQYSPAQGWIPFEANRPETPLDSVMMFGKLFDHDKINQAIQKLPDSVELKWDTLDECLRFMSFDDLNKRIKLHFDSTHNMIGKFPDSVFLLRK